MASHIRLLWENSLSSEQATILENQTELEHKPALVLLRLKDLAQAREVLSLRRALLT